MKDYAHAISVLAKHLNEAERTQYKRLQGLSDSAYLHAVTAYTVIAVLATAVTRAASELSND